VVGRTGVVATHIFSIMPVIEEETAESLPTARQF